MKDCGFVKVSARFDNINNKNTAIGYAFDRHGNYVFPKDARYEVAVNLPFPFGRLVSPIEYGIFLGYGCKSCGFEYDGYYEFGSPCKNCGRRTVVSLTRPPHDKMRNIPHIHGNYWVFELHILDYDVSVALGEFLGIDFDSQLRFSCKGSWHNFCNDSSGFDICHVSCLNRLIETSIKEKVKGIDLFMKLYPDEGKVLCGYGRNYKVFKYWKDGELRPVSEYFVSRSKGIPVHGYVTRR